MAVTWQPVKLTALSHAQRALRATFVEHHGWQVAARFATPEQEEATVRQGVGLADVSWLGKLDVKGSRLEEALVHLPSGRTWHLARGHALVTSQPADREALVQALQARGQERARNNQVLCLHVTDVTSAYAALLLAGPQSREILRRLTALNVTDAALPDLACARTGLAHTHVTVLRQDLSGVLTYVLLVAREHGEFLWDVLMHAGHESGMVPFGLETLQRLGEVS
jgi:heterotetrameric sarcosine oxidase gamma subunit